METNYTHRHCLLYGSRPPARRLGRHSYARSRPVFQPAANRASPLAYVLWTLYRNRLFLPRPATGLSGFPTRLHLPHGPRRPAISVHDLMAHSGALQQGFSAYRESQSVKKQGWGRMGHNRPGTRVPTRAGIKEYDHEDMSPLMCLQHHRLFHQTSSFQRQLWEFGGRFDWHAYLNSLSLTFSSDRKADFAAESKEESSGARAIACSIARFALSLSPTATSPSGRLSCALAL
jgi:hypothetical protein